MMYMPRVLVVDDDPYILMSLELLMSKAGYQVMVARNGQEALSMTRIHEPHLMILDIMMPDIDGYDICRKVRATAQGQKMKIIFLSARIREEDIRKGYEAGATLYITKPFSTRHLVQQVKNLLEESVTEEMAPEDTHAAAMTHPASFWEKQARKLLWFQFPTNMYTPTSEGREAWFADGMLNTSFLALDRHVQEGRSDQPALHWDSPVTGRQKTFTYSELLDATALAAGMLQRLGVGRGDRVMLYMPMIPEAVVLMLACARLGAIHAVVFGGFAPKELAARIQDATPKVLVTASCGIEGSKVIPYVPLVEDALRFTEFLPPVVLLYQRPELKEILPDGWLDAAECLHEAAPAGYVRLNATDPLYILYTSGTTGKPKGIVRDHGSHAVALRFAMEHIYGVNAGDTFWAASDIGWVVGHSFMVYGPLLMGGTTILYEGKPVKTPDAGAFWRVIDQYKVQILFTAPTALRAIRQEDPEGKALSGRSLSSLQAIFLAGEKCDVPTLEWIRELTGKPAIDHWWQTETGWPITAIAREKAEYEVVPGSVGLPVPGFQVQILHPDGTQAEAGEEGHIVLKRPLPPGCFSGLWNETSEKLASYFKTFPGYYDSGDGGRIDEKGYVWVTGRVDDIINVAGHRLSTGGMETILTDHPQVIEAAVVAQKDALRGQIPVGFVVAMAGADTHLASDLVQRVREQLGAIAFLKTIYVVQRLPKTRSGKILRRSLRQCVDREPILIPPTIEDPLVFEEIRKVVEGNASL